MKSLINKNILKIKPYIPGKPIEEVRRELEIKGPVIKLASNENPLPPSNRVIAAIKRNLKSLNRYPDGGCFYLKKTLARKFRLKPENIIVGNGSDELVVLALRAFASPNDEAVIAKPTFLVYEIASAVQGLKIRAAPVNKLRYDLKRMAGLVNEKTKIIFIANPDNPCGSYVTKDELDLFLKEIGGNTIIFIDEAYYDFAKDCKDYPNSLKYLNKKNIIVTRTFSKVYSLAGLRIGYGLAKEELIEAMNKVKEPFNVNSLAQAGALAALEDAKFINKSLNIIRIGKEYLYRSLETLGYEYAKTATNFILVNLKRDSEVIYRRLLKKGVIVREMSPWGLRGYIRVTVGTMSENRRFIRALREVRD